MHRHRLQTISERSISLTLILALLFSLQGCSDDPLYSDKHIDITYEYKGFSILREMYPRRSLLYILDRNGKKKEGSAELYYREGYDATLAYDKHNNEIRLLLKGHCCTSYSLDTSICKLDTSDLYYEVYFNDRNERYDVVKLDYYLIHEIGVNQKEKKRLGEWSILYPEESISYYEIFVGDRWIGFVHYPRKEYKGNIKTNNK